MIFGLFLSFTILLSSCGSDPAKNAGADICLADNGKAEYLIVVDDRQDGAALELKWHLDKITGCDFRILKEKDYDGKSPAIFLGNTEFARSNKASFDDFSLEEWLIRTVGGNVIIGGGELHGTLYGVYDLLENQLDCHWFTFESISVPSRRKLTFPNLDVHRKPAFAERHIFTRADRMVNPDVIKAYGDFMKRNRNGSIFRESRQYYPCHNFYRFVDPDKYFASHPEYFSMDKNGKRFFGQIGASHQGGELCLSNPDVVKITMDSLREFIRKDRDGVSRQQWPNLYDISQMDECSFLCKCPNCAAITQREGGDSGLLLYFLNQIARKVAKEYPQIMLRTLTYVSTETAPKFARPEPNLMVTWCDLYSRSDCYRPLKSRFNTQQYKTFEDWLKTGAKMRVWDYCNMGEAYFNPPRIETMVDAIQPDLKLFHDSGVRACFIEMETLLSGNMQNFVDLQIWLGYQLMLDPQRDAEPLIDLYMTRHYGPAAEPMEQFLHLVRKEVEEVNVPIPYNSSGTNTYISRAFLQKCHDLLMKARLLAPAGSDYRKRVEKEMISPLAVILRKPELKIAADYNSLRQLYYCLRTDRIKNYYPLQNQKEMQVDLDKEMTVLSLSEIPTPEKFRDLPEDQIRKFVYVHFSHYRGAEIVINDPDSTIGKAVVTVPGSAHNTKNITSEPYPNAFGLYDSGSKSQIVFTAKDVPKDEKYHWYKVGFFDFHKNSILWMYFWQIRADLSSVWRPDDGVPDLNKWNVWVSAKFTGPAYVDSSKKDDAVYVDYVILTKEK